MASQANPIWLMRQLLLTGLLAGKARRQGFTLLELLVAILIGSILISGLLYLAVELLQVSRREEVLTQTQQDMQRALDYINQDVQEAVYVYSTPGVQTDPNSIAGMLSADNSFPDAGDATPILAFWRVDPLTATDLSKIPNCASVSTALKGECSALEIRQGTYTLVVYLQEENGDGTVWEGPSRIIRYVLPKYSNIATLAKTSGYVDPTLPDSSFEGWSPDGSVDGPPSQVLTDFVDFMAVTGNPDCPANYQLTPSDGSSDSFYVCVRDIVPTGLGAEGNSNQSLIVYLRGNAIDGREGLINLNDESSRTPTLESEVLVRGILDKRP